MNPYYPNQYTYPNPQGYFPYAQPQYQQYQPQPKAPSIEEMYTTVHPYNNQQFLLKTFGNKVEYIRVFLTLSHQDKLKMYMLMEEKKLYGEINDKQSYQKILKQIVQKVQNYNLFHQNKSQKENIQELKSKDLQNKIDSIVQKTFQKLKLNPINPNNQQGSPRLQQKVLTSANQSQAEEWIQVSQPQQTNKAEQNFNIGWQTATYNQPNSQNQFKQNQFKENQMFNMFTFDSTMEEAMTHQIGLKTTAEMEKKSIWDLQVLVQQGDQPNIKQVFKSKSHKQVQNIQNNKQAPKSHFSRTTKNISNVLEYNSKYQQSNYEPFNNSFKFSNNSAQLYGTQPFALLNQQKNYAEKYLIKNVPLIIQQNVKMQNTIQGQEIFNLSNSPVISSIPQSTLNEVNSLKHQLQQQIPEQQWVQGDNYINSQEAPANIVQRQNNVQNYQQNYDLYQQTEIFNPITQTKHTAQIESDLLNNDFNFNNSQNGNHIPSAIPQQTLQIDFNFDILGSFPKQTQSVNTESLSLNMPKNQLSVSTEHLNNFVLDNSNINQQGSYAYNQMYEPMKQDIKVQRMDLIKSTLSYHDQQKQLLLEKLKIQINSTEKQLIIHKLKDKSFECDTQFYQIFMNYLRQISLQWSPQYIFFTQQYKVVKQLHQESQRYTMAVDQDQEEKVSTSIKKTKVLLNQIYKNSIQTEKYVINLLDLNSKEKGLLYKFGRVLVNSSINNDILSKTFSQENKKQMLNSFYTLFIVQKLSSIQKIKNYSQKLIYYLTIQYEKYRLLDQQKTKQIQLQLQKYPKYKQYVTGLVRMCNICQRMVGLLKICNVKTQSNMVKTLKICKQIKTKYSHINKQQENTSNPLQLYQQPIKKGIERNKSVYDLHNIFLDIYGSHPICAICLRLIQNDGNKNEDIYYHYSCFNIFLHLDKQQAVIAE